MSLPPRTLAALAAGPVSVCDHYVEHIAVMRNESLEEFARRIAQIAMEEEREECAKVCIEVRDALTEQYHAAGGADLAADWIRARGKP